MPQYLGEPILPHDRLPLLLRGCHAQFALMSSEKRSGCLQLAAPLRFDHHETLESLETSVAQKCYIFCRLRSMLNSSTIIDTVDRDKTQTFKVSAVVETPTNATKDTNNVPSSFFIILRDPDLKSHRWIHSRMTTITFRLNRSSTEEAVSCCCLTFTSHN